MLHLRRMDGIPSNLLLVLFVSLLVSVSFVCMSLCSAMTLSLSLSLPRAVSLLSRRKMKSNRVLFAFCLLVSRTLLGCTATVAFHRCNDTTSLSCGQLPAQALFVVYRHAFSPYTPLSV